MKERRRFLFLFGFGQIHIIHQKSRKGGWGQRGRKEGRGGGGEKIVEEGEVVDEVERGGEETSLYT